MTAFTTLLNALFIPGKPILGSTGTALRDNIAAQGEADPSVPLNQLPSVLLGTLTTTSGATQTLSGLVLTPYKALRITVSGVSCTSAASLTIAGQGITAALGSAAANFTGSILIDLSNGIATGLLADSTSGSGSVRVAATGYSTATTSIVFGWGAGNFDAGTITIWGIK